MKINRPTIFYPEAGGLDGWNASHLEAAMKRSTLITRGDVIRKYAEFDSNIEADWHTVEDQEHDSWVKFSFDGGEHWLLKFRYKNTLLMKFFKEGTASRGDMLSFDFSNYSALDYSSIRNGRISLYSVCTSNEVINPEEWYTHLSNYRYRFDDDAKKLNVFLTMTPPSDTSKIMLLIELDGHSAMAMAVPTTVFSSTVGMVQTTHDDYLGYYGVLDTEAAENSTTSVVTNSPLTNVKKLQLKLKSADDNSGTVYLKFNCGAVEFEQAVAVSGTPSWVSIPLYQPLDGGQLTITRLSGNSADTLNAACYVLDIIVTVFD